MTQQTFSPTRTAALQALSDFLPKAGPIYAAQRNYDLGAGHHAGVSCLSPYIRHRMLPETEVLQAVLGRFSASSAEKYIQEVLWRTYWKGWLEQRPTVWSDYQAGLNQALNNAQTQSGLRRAWEQACLGHSGIECFDHWARELAETGYLHNHARMWFASIWIFTLKLPWELGADFFMRHLLDGDPASNTLGWRWVAGLQTIGRTYPAKADNIAKYTNGRFHPTNLAAFADPLEGRPHPALIPLCEQQQVVPDQVTGLLITEEDMNPTNVLAAIGKPATVAGLTATNDRSELTVSENVTQFVNESMNDTLTRLQHSGAKAPLYDTPNDVINWAQRNGLTQVVTAHAPVGPTATALADLEASLKTSNIGLIRIKRPLDVIAWPHATKGFFAFKKNIPSILSELFPA